MADFPRSPRQPPKPNPGKPLTKPPKRPASPREPAFARDIVESISDPMVVYDPQWRVRYENAAAQKAFLSTGRSSLVGRTLWAEYPDLAGTEFEREMRRAMDERIPTTFVERRRGRWVWTEVRCYPLPDGGLAAVWKDITEQKRSEQAIRVLSDVSALLTQTFDHEAACDALAQLLIPELADWCVISLAEPQGIKLVAMAHADPAKVAKARELYEKYPAYLNGNSRTAWVIRTGKSDILTTITPEMIDAGFQDTELRDLVKSLGLVSQVVVPLMSRGRVLGAMTLVGTGERHYQEKDLALAELIGRRAAMAVDNALLYREAQHALAVATAANEHKSSFLARMSHELRTPLNAIGGYVDLLLLGVRGEMNADQKTDVERIKRSQHHLLSLINDLLNFARVESGQLTYDVQDVCVSDLLGNVEALFAPQLLQKKLAFRLELPDPSLKVRADKEKAQQIVFNLMSNAVKYTRDGGRISARARAAGDRVEIIVEDSGLGIPAEKLEAVFEPFVQLARGGVVSEGTGLGLAISRDLARGMGGDLEGRSEGEGKGATFVLRLPRVTP